VILLEEELLKKLKNLEISLENKIIKKEEYEKEKQKIQNELKKIKKLNEEPKEEFIKKKSDKILIYSLILIILFFAIFFAFRFFNKVEIKTLDDLHSLNLNGKLKPEQGYIYNGFSFVFYDDLWNTKVQQEDTVFYISLHYSPKELEDISLAGQINATLFDSSDFIYYTFDPLLSDQRYVALSAGEFVRSIIAAFNKIPKAACDKNETKACSRVPILTCNNTNLPLVYFKHESPTKVIYDKNCLIAQGEGLEIVRATDRMLLNIYGIM